MTSERLGEAKIPGLPYENPDGTSIRIDIHYFYTVPPSETAVLVSEDGGENWHPATPEDFRFPDTRRQKGRAQGNEGNAKE